MMHVAEVSVVLDTAEGAGVTFSDTLEVSLDCCVCRRCWRTVVFELGQAAGRCMPTGHPFPGRILEKRVEGSSATYRIEYEYELFVDAKYPVRRPQPRPTWGRVGFTVTCPRCGARQQRSVQNNSSRPWTLFCECGHALYSERTEMPRFDTLGERDQELTAR